MAGRIIIGTANPSLDGNGKPVAGSTLTFYANRTTTLASVYSGIGLTTPLSNPLTCDATGEFPQVWAPSLTAYSVKWSRPGLADVTYDDIFVSSDAGQALNYGPEVNVAAAATTDLNTSTANRQVVLGNTGITSFGTGALLYRILRFTGTPLLTYNATSLITPTGLNIQAAAGDVAIVASDASGNWTILSYLPYGGQVLGTFTGVNSTTSLASAVSISVPAGSWEIGGNVEGVSSGDAYFRATISTTAGGAGTPGLTDIYGAISSTLGSLALVPTKFTFAVTTTVYLNLLGNVGAATAYSGFIRAKRII